MTLTERLADAHQRSVALYLRRQQIEAQRQQVAQQAALCDQALVKADGEIELLERMLAEDAATARVAQPEAVPGG